MEGLPNAPTRPVRSPVLTVAAPGGSVPGAVFARRDRGTGQEDGAGRGQ